MTLYLSAVDIFQKAGPGSWRISSLCISLPIILQKPREYKGVKGWLSFLLELLFVSG